MKESFNLPAQSVPVQNHSCTIGCIFGILEADPVALFDHGYWQGQIRNAVNSSEYAVACEHDHFDGIGLE